MNTLASEIIHKTFEFKLRMNRKFEAACVQALDDARDLYNAALQQRISLYKMQARASVTTNNRAN